MGSVQILLLNESSSRINTKIYQEKPSPRILLKFVNLQVFTKRFHASLQRLQTILERFQFYKTTKTLNYFLWECTSQTYNSSHLKTQRKRIRYELENCETRAV